MSEATSQVPAEHVEAIRQSLSARLDDAARVDEVRSLLRQIDDGPSGAARPHALTGSRAVLWNAVYEALCTASERFAEECNEYWRGAVDPDQARAGIARIAERLELLVALGAPPRP